jgi:hypothetical protein
MRGTVQTTVVLIALVGLLAAPILPPEHMHRGALGSAHGRTLVHRHFAPHTTANGTHIDHPGVAEGAPLWLGDPIGSLPHPPSMTGQTTLLLSHALIPPLGAGESVAAAPEASVHGPPPLPLSSRAPPSQL